MAKRKKGREVSIAPELVSLMHAVIRGIREQGLDIGAIDLQAHSAPDQSTPDQASASTRAPDEASATPPMRVSMQRLSGQDHAIFKIMNPSEDYTALSTAQRAQILALNGVGIRYLDDASQDYFIKKEHDERKTFTRTKVEHYQQQHLKVEMTPELKKDPEFMLHYAKYIIAKGKAEHKLIPLDALIIVAISELGTELPTSLTAGDDAHLKLAQRVAEALSPALELVKDNQATSWMRFANALVNGLEKIFGSRVVAPVKSAIIDVRPSPESQGSPKSSDTMQKGVSSLKEMEGALESLGEALTAPEAELGV